MSRKIRKVTSQKMVTRARRQMRNRMKISGTAERPRLAIYKGGRCICAQLINDDKGVTLAAITSAPGKTMNKVSATDLGKNLAQKALGLGIKACVFDRAGFQYHGRIEAFAKGAREGGLNF